MRLCSHRYKRPSWPNLSDAFRRQTRFHRVEQLRHFLNLLAQSVLTVTSHIGTLSNKRVTKALPIMSLLQWPTKPDQFSLEHLFEHFRQFAATGMKRNLVLRHKAKPWQVLLRNPESVRRFVGIRLTRQA